MLNSSMAGSNSCGVALNPGTPMRTRICRTVTVIFILAMVLLASRVVAQNSPHVAAVAPDSGKVNDSVTITGENLGKDGVAAAFLSDDTMDFKGVIVEQAADKIVMKVPQVKAGRYNISI